MRWFVLAWWLLFPLVAWAQGEPSPMSFEDLEVIDISSPAREAARAKRRADIDFAEETIEGEVVVGPDRIRVLPRIGGLQVGEESTAIAGATPHREEAYRASRYIIEELQERLPVWKKEHYADGDSHWVGSNPPTRGSGISGEVLARIAA